MNYSYSGDNITSMIDGFLDSAELADAVDENGDPVEGEWTDSARARARVTCVGFLACVAETLNNPSPTQTLSWINVPAALLPGGDHGQAEYMGHNLWLSSQGHGTGFWDRGYGPAGDLFHKWAKTFSHDVYVTDSGKLELS